MSFQRLPAQETAQGHSQCGCGLPDLVECAHQSRPAHRGSLRRSRCAPDRLPRLLSERICAAHDESALTIHPNVGGVLLVSLGCESFNREALAGHVAARRSGRWKTIVIQKAGGTRSAIDRGVAAVIGDEAEGFGHGGSSADAAERARGRHDLWRLGRHQRYHCESRSGARVRSPGRGGCDLHLRGNRRDDRLRRTDGGACQHACNRLKPSSPRSPKPKRITDAMGFGSFAPGNAEGGLSSQEEKSAGAYVKSGSSPIVGVIKPAEVPDERLGCICSTWCPTVRRSLAFRTSRTTRRSSS